MSTPITLDYVADWTARLRSRLYTQFRGKITWEKWVVFLGQQFQDLEDATQTLFGFFDIDNVSGVQLDLIGRLVGQQRNGVDDATYRSYLKARIVANRSTGTPEDLYRVFRALYGSTIGLVVTTSDIGVKAFSIRVRGVITHAQAMVGRVFLRDSKEAGARALLEWQEDVDANLFRFDSGPGFDAGLFAGGLPA